MSQRQPREDRRTVSSSKHLPVAAKCLAIVLFPQKKHSKSNHSQDVNKGSGDQQRIGGVGSGSGGAVNSGNTTKSVSPYNGKEILEDFKQQNKTCYWNPALIESIRQLEYLGFVEPSTVLVSGEDIHLENLRSAWGRRVLKAPTNFTIDRIGDVNGIEMQVIPQTQFIPLPDSLCLIIAELNNGSQPATLESIRARLQRWYSHTNLPTHQLIYDTLGQLIRERKVFHDGNGYCVVTPEMYPMASTTDPSLACTASWLPYHPMYIPVFPPQQQQQPPFRAPTRSISCQVTQIEDKQSSEGSHHQQQQQQQQAAAEKKRSRPRSHSVRACRGKDKAQQQAEKENADFKRSTSTRYRSEKAKAMTKDLNLKTSNLNQEKDKGEKASIFSKLFGRSKKKSKSTGGTIGTATASTSSGGGGGGCNQSAEAEFATFSAQFPPPEWLWYQQQLERQRRTEEWVTQQIPKSATWGQLMADGGGSSSAGGLLSSAGAEGGGSSHQTAVTDPPIFLHHHHPYSQHHQQHGGGGSRPQSHVYATLGHQQGGTAVDGAGGGVVGVGGGLGARGARGEDERKMKQQHRMSGSHARKSHHHHNHHHHNHHRDRDRGGGEHLHHQQLQQQQYGRLREHRKTLQESNYDVPASTNYGVLSSRPPVSSPYSLEEDEDNIYSTPGPCQYGHSGGLPPAPWHSTPCYDVPPAHFDSLAMPSQIVHNSTSTAANTTAAGTTTATATSTTTQQHHHHQDASAAGKTQSSHSHNPQQRRSHRSKRHKSHKVYAAATGGGSGGGNDISIEYKGRMPKKNSSVVQSRDSGVNCMGLPQSQQPPPEQSRQRYLGEGDSHQRHHHHHHQQQQSQLLQITQEASAYLPTSRLDLPMSTMSVANHTADTVSTQRGTPYASMEGRSPEGCSQSQSQHHHQQQYQPVLNTIVSPSTSDMQPCERSPLSDADPTQRGRSGPSGTSAGGEEEEEGEEEARKRRTQGSLRREEDLTQEDNRREDDFTQLEMRSEGEGVSVGTSPHYMNMDGSSSGDPSCFAQQQQLQHQLQQQQQLTQDELDDPNSTPHFVAMSYCDSSLGEDGAGGGEVMLCQAEINIHGLQHHQQQQFQVPQLVLDTESSRHHDYGARLSSGEPDIALSSAGSKDTLLDRTPNTADESERSAETVVCSPQFAALQHESSSNHFYKDSTNSESRFSDSKTPERSDVAGVGGGSDVSQSRFVEDASNAMQPSGEASLNEETLSSSAQGGCGGEGRAERCMVSALGSEFRELGVVDSGFSSPRNSNNNNNNINSNTNSQLNNHNSDSNKDSQQQLHQQQTQQLTAAAVAGKKSHYHFHPHPSHSHNNPLHQDSVTVAAAGGGDSAAAPAAATEEPLLTLPPVQEHKSKHERIKAFVKQTNQLLEQRQFTGHGNIPFGGAGVVDYPPPASVEEVVVDAYSNYPPPVHHSTPITSSSSHHPHSNPHPHPHQQHYGQFSSKGIHPPSSQHHMQQAASQQPLQQQQQQPAVSAMPLNNQRNYHHHHYSKQQAPVPQPSSSSRPHSIHDGSKEQRPKSQNFWPGQGHSQGQVLGPNGEKLSPKDLKAFQELQHRGKKFGLNGEFEVVGVV